MIQVSAGEAVDSVLQARHVRETSELLAQQYDERCKALRLALEALLDNKREEKAELLDQLQTDNAPQASIDQALAGLEESYAAKRSEVRSGFGWRLVRWGMCRGFTAVSLFCALGRGVNYCGFGGRARGATSCVAATSAPGTVGSVRAVGPRRRVAQI